MDERTHIIVGKLLVLVKGEFLVLDGLLNSERGPFVNLKVQITGMGAEGLGINGCEADLSLVFLGKRLEGLC